MAKYKALVTASFEIEFDDSESDLVVADQAHEEAISQLDNKDWLEISVTHIGPVAEGEDDAGADE